MVGGSTRIPKVRSLVSEFFDGKELDKTLNPDTCVARGASILAEMMVNGETEEFQDVLNHNFGI